MEQQLRDALSKATLLRRHQVQERTGLSRSAIYAKLHSNPKRPWEHDPSFPAPVQLGARAVAWIEAEIDAWIVSKIEQSRRSV